MYFAGHSKYWLKYFKLDRHMYALRNPRNYKHMDLDLVNAMVEALKDTG